MSSVSVDLTRYSYRPMARLTACAALSPRVAEIASTHPLLFFALATNYGPLEARIEALRAIEAGKSLATACKALNIPVCLRRLPPEACRTRLAFAEWSPEAARVLGNHVPEDPAAAANWLEAICYASQACTETFALWIARQDIILPGPPLQVRHLLPLAVYAWHSINPGGTIHAMVSTPWCPQMAMQTAIAEARRFLNRTMAQVYLDDTPMADLWAPSGEFRGYTYIAVDSSSGIIEEHFAMRNCVDCYVRKTFERRSRIYSVRKGTKRVATIELIPGPGGELQLNHIKGPGNTEAPVDVHRAVRRWLAVQRPLAEVKRPSTPQDALDAKLQQLLVHYRVDRERSQQWVGAISVDTLDNALTALALRAGLGGWQFRQV